MKDNNLPLLLLLLFIVSPWVSSFAEDELYIHQVTKSLQVEPFLSYYMDQGGKLSIEDISAPDFQNTFQHNDGKQPLAFSGLAIEDTLWLRFETSNNITKDKTYLLVYEIPLVDHFNFYYTAEENSSTYLEKQSGRALPYITRDIKNRKLIFEIEIRAKEKQTFYLSLYGHETIRTPIRLTTKKTFFIQDAADLFTLGSTWGLLLILSIFNIMVYFNTKNISFLLLALSKLAYLFLDIGLNGFDMAVFYPNGSPLSASYINFCSGMTTLFMLLFFKNFMETRKHTPRLNMVLNLLFIPIGIYLILVFFLHHSILINIIYRLAIGIMAMITITTIAALKKTPYARSYLAAHLVEFIGVAIYMLFATGILPPNPLTLYSRQFGTSLSYILLAFSLAQRINRMKQEKALVQQAALEEQKDLTQGYARFVPLKLLTLLGKQNITQVALGDHIHKNMTIFFADIRSFTHLSENMSPRDNFRFVNSFFSFIGPIVRGHYGFIDKYIGDGIMAVFIEQPENALNTAVEIIRSLEYYNQSRRESGYQPIEIGIGINTGDLVFGTIGEENRMDGTATSSTVNTATYMEYLAKEYSIPLVITEHTYNALNKPEFFSVRQIDRIKTPSSDSSYIKVYEVYDGDKKDLYNRKKKANTHFKKALRLYFKKRFDQALELFYQFHKEVPEDTVTDIYIQRCLNEM